jgi:hypothetical protein
MRGMMVSGNSLATMYVDQTSCSTTASSRAGRDKSKSAIVLTCDSVGATDDTQNERWGKEGRQAAINCG